MSIIQKGRYRVTDPATGEVHEHNRHDKAYDKAIEIGASWVDPPQGWEVMGFKLDTSDPAPTVNTPPTVLSTPAPSAFTEGTSASYDMSQHIRWGTITGTFSLTGSMGGGLSFDTSTGLLSYDGQGAASDTSHQLQADDGVNVPVQSNVFFITVNALVGDPPNITGPYGYNVNNDGTQIVGGRGLAPRFYTNLNVGGAGSLAELLASDTGGPILPEITGVIDCTAVGTKHKVQGAGNKTLYGNCAPPGGVNLQGGGSAIQIDVGNIIIRHVRILMGDEAGGENPTFRNCFKINKNTTNNRDPKDILVEHCTMAFATDQLWAVSKKGADTPNDNFTFFRCLAGYPIREGGHNQTPHNKGPLINGANRFAMIECLVAHVEGRPRFKTAPFGCMLNCVLYQWSGVFVSVDSNAGSPAMKFWMEGNQWIPDDNGTQGPQYAGPIPGAGANQCISSFDGFGLPEELYLNDNDFGGIDQGIGGSGLVNRVTALADIQMPADYADRIQTQTAISSVGNLANTLNGWGANPTFAGASNAVDVDMRASVVNKTGTWIDDVSEIPSGGYPTVPAQTHQQVMGKTLEQWFKDNVGEANYALVAPGKVNETQFEVAARGFINGIPPT